MSHDAHLKVAMLRRPMSYPSMLTLLFESGWSLDNTAGGIQYYIANDEGDPEVQTADLGSAERVLSILAGCEAGGGFFAIDLSRNGIAPSIWLAFNNSDEFQSGFSMSPRFGRPVLKGPGRVTDINWYLESVLFPVLRAGCEIAWIEWKEGS